jgi:hypothetical protein
LVHGVSSGAVAARKCGELVADIVQVARDYRVLREGPDCT